MRRLCFSSKDSGVTAAPVATSVAIVALDGIGVSDDEKGKFVESSKKMVSLVWGGTTASMVEILSLSLLILLFLIGENAPAVGLCLILAEEEYAGAGSSEGEKANTSKETNVINTRSTPYDSMPKRTKSDARGE